MDQNLQENYEELKKQRRLMVLNYKKEQHLELLKLSQELKRQKNL